MKQLVLSTVFVLTASLAFSQDLNFAASQPCGSVENVFEMIYSQYGETPLFTGVGIQISASNGQPYSGNTMFFVNQDTGSWTHIVVYGDGNACMLANGSKFEPYSN